MDKNKGEVSFFKVLIISFICCSPFGILSLLDVPPGKMPSFALFFYDLIGAFASIFYPIRLGFYHPNSPRRLAFSILIPSYIWWVIIIINGIIQEINTGVSHLSLIGLVPFINIFYSGWIFGMVYIGKTLKFLKEKNKFES